MTTSDRDGVDDDDAEGRTREHANKVAALTATIRRCDLCGTPLHFIPNVFTITEEPRLSPTTCHVICDQFRALSTHVRVLEDGLTEMAADFRPVRDKVFPPEHQSLRARIRSVAKLTLSRLASRL